ncbi:MAG TPA: cytochrome P450 [Burkholderiales bacterium]|nr:cytochrome P450 [Burkholderiales bacterium]
MLPLVAGSNPPPVAGEALDISFSEDMLAKLLRYFTDLGDAFRIPSSLTGTAIHVFSHPEHVRHVLVDNHSNYTKGLGIERVGILLGNGIMVSEGDLWRRQRKLLQPAFHRDVIARMFKHIRAANHGLREKWLRAARAGTAINVTHDMSEVALEVILRSIFGDDLEWIMARHGSNPFALLIDDTQRNLAFAYKFRALSGLVAECIARRRAHAGEKETLLDMLIEARDRKSGEPMPERLLLDETMTLIVAGHETTASALNWAWYLLSNHPAAEKHLHEEVDRLPQLPATLDAIAAQLPYTRQVIEESMRLYPPGWLLTRKSVGPDTIAGYSIPANADVFISPYLVHRHPQFWLDPERFDPERFSAAQVAERDRFCYLPFALGPRACIGEHFAMAEMTWHIALLARDIRLHPLPQQRVELECQINLRSKYPVMMRPELRR